MGQEYFIEFVFCTKHCTSLGNAKVNWTDTVPPSSRGANAMVEEKDINEIIVKNKYYLSVKTLNIMNAYTGVLTVHLGSEEGQGIS